MGEGVYPRHKLSLDTCGRVSALKPAFGGAGARFENGARWGLVTVGGFAPQRDGIAPGSGHTE